MRSKKIEILLRNSEERRRRFLELNAPKAIIDDERKIIRRLRAAKMIDYKGLLRKILNRVRCQP